MSKTNKRVLSFQISSRRPFGNKSETAATSVNPVAAKKKILNAVMPKGRDIGVAMCDYIELMWQETHFFTGFSKCW